MVQIGNVPEINAVKNELEELKQAGLIAMWELPYENILTRLTAAIFFITPTDNTNLPQVWSKLSERAMFTYRPNEEKKLSQLDWRVEFNKGFEI
jgi:hypothetical protein